MTRLILISLLFATAGRMCWADDNPSGLQVDVKRIGHIYALSASIATSLTKCAAYNYLTDYDAARELPGIIESNAYRESSDHVKVERIAYQRILFFHVRLYSIMEYVEQPYDGISFDQLSGDSRMFRGNWEVEQTRMGSTLKFQGWWEPDTFIPYFIIDHFTKVGLTEKFADIVALAEKLKNTLPTICTRQERISANGTSSNQLVAQDARVSK